MSSNIEIIRNCEYCKKDFCAKTTKTRYCSHQCNSRHYKVKVRQSKIHVSNLETKNIVIRSYEEIKIKEFLTVKDVAVLLSCSKKNIYNMIKSGKLKTSNILVKKILVKRSDIDKLFKEL